MESRASNNVTFVALRYLRRHLHHGLSWYPLGARNSSSAAAAAAEIRGQSREECCFFETDVPGMGNAEKSLMENTNAGLRILLPSMLRCGHERSNKAVHEGEIYRVKQTLSVREPSIIPRHYRQRSAREDDFCSTYLQWKRYDQLSHSLDPVVLLPTEAVGAGAVEATRKVGDILNVTSVSRSKCGSNLFSFWPLSILDQEPRTMATIPLEASSVKKKRKKKMNKHKQRKLRRRDRHRN